MIGVAGAGLCADGAPANGRWMPKGQASAQLILAAIATEKPEHRTDATVTGITVPHHLLAADLMARGFWTVSRRDCKRVIVLSPDHFKRARRPFATTVRNFDTVLGPLGTDKRAVRRLLRSGDLFEESTLFENEHGVAALLPFVRHFFPRAKVVAVAISVNAKRETVERGVAALKAIADRDTLIVQSTDFSHYLPISQAVLRDQETLNTIAAGDPNAIFDLLPVDHLDSQGAQYVQMRLQADVYGARPVIVANRNSEHYGPSNGSTTSYLVQVYGPDPVALGAFRYADQQVTYFAGDTMPGRFWGPLLVDPKVNQAVVKRILGLTHGAPLIVNLEGALVDMPTVGLPPMRLPIESVLAVPLLKAINVKAVSLANNHAHDLGAEGAAIAPRLLKGAGIVPVGQGAFGDVNGLRFVALNFIGNASYDDMPITRDADFDAICKSDAKPPLFAFVHWGREYTNTAEASEHRIAERLLQCGVQGVIGGHSHRAAQRLETLRGGGMLMVYSLGNFMFDQKKNDVSSALLEVRVFKQGTFSARLVPIENLFAYAQTQAGMKP